MVPFVVIVSLELADRPAQRGFANQDHAVEARLLYRAHKALGDGVEIRRARWQADRVGGEFPNCAANTLNELEVR